MEHPVLAIACRGYSGYFSFGHGAFFGIGMYATAVLAGRFDWPFLATLPAAALLPALLGLGLGFVVFRVKAVRGELFALLTLAVTFVAATIILNTPIDGGPGIYLNAVAVPGIGPTPSASLYLLMLLAMVVALLVSWRVQASSAGHRPVQQHPRRRRGRRRGDGRAHLPLQAAGLRPARAGWPAWRAASMRCSCRTRARRPARPSNITVPLTVVLMSVLGGTRFWGGPAVGAAAITGLLYLFTAGDHAVAGKAAVGVVLVLVILFMPKGILGFVFRRKAVPRTWNKAQHVVPDRDPGPQSPPRRRPSPSANPCSKSTPSPNPSRVSAR